MVQKRYTNKVVNNTDLPETITKAMSEAIDRTDLTNVEVPQNFTIDNQEPQSDAYVVNNNIVSLGEPPKMKLKKKKTKKGRSPPRRDPARTIWSASDAEKPEDM